MRLLGDWKWRAALAAFLFLTALVVWLPRHQAKPADVVATPPSPTSTADMPSGRPDPSAEERESMLQYTVQDNDTVYSIARLFVISEEDLRWANHISGGGEFNPGDKIWVPAP